MLALAGVGVCVLAQIAVASDRLSKHEGKAQSLWKTTGSRTESQKDITSSRKENIQSIRVRQFHSGWFLYVFALQNGSNS